MAFDPTDTLTVARPRCGPDHGESAECGYRVAWQINPHMKPGAADTVRAEAQHRTLVEALRRAGAAVIELPFVHGAFDSVFIKDSALLNVAADARTALMARFATEVRQREQSDRGRALERAGFEVVDAVGPTLEGGDVARFPDGSALLGYGFRSDRRAQSVLRAFFEAPVLALELVDPWLYHLDTALTILSDGTVLCCREAFTEESLRRLARHPSLKELLFVPRNEALGFSLNVVQVGGTVLTGAAAPVTTRLIEERGLRVRPLKLSEFQLAGGSAACLVSRVYVERRIALPQSTAL